MVIDTGISEPKKQHMTLIRTAEVKITPRQVYRNEAHDEYFLSLPKAFKYVEGFSKNI